MNATLVCKCKQCKITYRTVVNQENYMALGSWLAVPLCYQCDAFEAEHEFWFDGPGGGPCKCGSYTCDGLCDSYAEYRKQQKQAELYEEGDHEEPVVSFSFECFMAKETVGHVLYMQDSDEIPF